MQNRVHEHFRNKPKRDINVAGRLLDEIGWLMEHAVHTGRVPADVSIENIYNA